MSGAPAARGDGAAAVSSTRRDGDGGPPTTTRAVVTCVDYSPGQVHAQVMDDLAGFLEHHRPDRAVVRWTDLAGLSDPSVIDAIARKYELHPLAIEDLLSRSQRPEIDAHGGEGSDLNARLFITTRTLRVEDDALRSGPASTFLGHTTVLTFQQAAFWAVCGLVVVVMITMFRRRGWF